MTHESTMTMVYDECYMPLLKHVKLAIIARVYRCGVPPFNPMVLIAMIHRWPDTHSFHLPCGEMTITLEDAAMILGLKIQGFPVIGDTESTGWGTSATRASARQEAAQQWCATEVASRAVSLVPTRSKRGDHELPLQGLGASDV